VSATPNSHTFDHTLNDDIIRLSQLDGALARLGAMRHLGRDMLRIERSILEEMDQLRHRIESRAKHLPPSLLS
jgi:hypothetical protein